MRSRVSSWRDSRHREGSLPPNGTPTVVSMADGTRFLENLSGINSLLSRYNFAEAECQWQRTQK
jgi:hypothetical protein